MNKQMKNETNTNFIFPVKKCPWFSIMWINRTDKQTDQ